MKFTQSNLQLILNFEIVRLVCVCALKTHSKTHIIERQKEWNQSEFEREREKETENWRDKNRKVSNDIELTLVHVVAHVDGLRVASTTKL